MYLSWKHDPHLAYFFAAVLQDGFSRGLSFGNDNFSIESLDPLSSAKR